MSAEIKLTEEMKKMPSFMVYEMAGKSADAVASETAAKIHTDEQKTASFGERLMEEINK